MNCDIDDVYLAIITEEHKKKVEALKRKAKAIRLYKSQLKKFSLEIAALKEENQLLVSLLSKQ